MNTFSTIYHMLRADFLERARRTSFFVILGVSLLAGYLYIPPANSTSLALALGPWRGVYNSAWVGVVFGILTVILLPLFGYFLIKNTIERDRLTRVGQIIATTPISKLTYMLGKWLSNLATLAAMLVMFNMMALFMQLYRAEVTEVDLWSLSAPIWMMGLPVIALTAAVALCFESVPMLSGSFGNAVYFVAWLLFMDHVGLPGIWSYHIGEVQTHADILGLAYPIASLQEIGRQVDPSFNGYFNFGGAEFGEAIQVVQWNGIDWMGPFAAGRLLWLTFAIGLAAIAALPFDRFDPALGHEAGRASGLKRYWEFILPARAKSKSFFEPPFVTGSKVALSPIKERMSKSRFGALLWAEFKLMLKGQRWWWYGIAVSISLLGLIGPPGGTNVTSVLAMAWPVAAWSALGMREKYHDTYRLIYSSTYSVFRQVFTAWFSGVLLGLIAIAGVSLRAIIEGDTGRIPVYLVAVLFVPSLAFALGTLSGTSRLFEAVYLVWWFMGANGPQALDFMQSQREVPSPVQASAYLGLAIVLLLFGFFRRLSEMRE
jgi:hypothetical protein